MAIDKQSLDSVGVWPWPRTVHAAITDRLRTLGAREIVFDIDFSTPSAPKADAAFAAAIARAGGTVTLPVFLQLREAGDQDAGPLVTEPIEELAENAWLATVNVVPDGDSKFRHFPTGEQAGDAFIASVPATIAGIPGAPGDQINIDFGINPATVPVVSVHDLLDGEIDKASIENKTVVIGAYAAELNDFFAVPRFSYISGAMLQILAAETVMAGRDLHNVDAMPIAAMAFILLLSVLFALGRHTSPQSLAAFAAIPLVAEPVAIFLYARYGLLVPTAFVHISALSALAIRSLSMTEFFRTLLNKATIDARNMRQVLQQVVRENFDAIVITEEEGNVLQASEAVRSIFDVGDRPPVTGMLAAAFLPGKISREIDKAITRSRDGETWVPETQILTFVDRNGAMRAIEYTIGISELKNEHGSNRAAPKRHRQFIACLTARDISERLSYEKKLQWISDFDELTGVRWRHAFVQYMESMIGDCGMSGGYAIIALNLHRFKTVNIALGRDTGNALLVGVASRLYDADPRILCQARLGGDSFAVLIGGVFDEKDAMQTAERISARIAAPFAIDRRRAQIGVQAGVTLCGATGDESIDTETMLERAEMALDEARAAGGSRIVLFDRALAEQRKRARIIERDLWQALEREELHLHYQLQVRLSDNSPRGAEALLRWSHAKLGDVSPEDFIPIAEANGFVVQLGRWTLLTACNEAVNWPEHLSVAVNIAPTHFASDDIITDVKTALAESGLAPHRLTIEIVESEFLDTTEVITRRIKALKALGVCLALDDFGTGYSAVGYLPQLHFDKIKMDRQFMKDLTTNPQTQGIFQSVTVLGDAFDMDIVCEGVETEEQASFLRLIGCDEGQGYLFSRPIGAEDFRRLIGSGPIDEKSVRAQM